MGLPNPSREIKFSGANADREVLFFLFQLTTCRIGNLTRLIHTLAICVTMHTYRQESAGTGLVVPKVARVMDADFSGNSVDQLICDFVTPLMMDMWCTTKDVN